VEVAGKLQHTEVSLQGRSRRSLGHKRKTRVILGTRDEISGLNFLEWGSIRLVDINYPAEPVIKLTSYRSHIIYNYNINFLKLN